MAVQLRNNLNGTYSVFVDKLEYVYDDKSHALLDVKDIAPSKQVKE